MAKIKTCKFFEQDRDGSVILIKNDFLACYDRGIRLDEIEDYKYINIEKLMQKRAEFINSIKCGQNNACDGCPQLYEIEEAESKTDKISWLNIASYTTCTLRCKYCYFNHDELGEKLEDEKRYLMPIIKQFHDKNLLSENICIAIAGGEPLLFKDIPETFDFLKENYKFPRFNLQSNCTVTPQVDLLCEKLQGYNFPWINLYTSLDSGTKETYSRIKERDLYDTVKNNIMKFAKSNIFTDIQLKYILLADEDKFNLSKDDITGFCEFVKEVKSATKSNVSIALDRDLRYGTSPLKKEELNAAIAIAKFAYKNDILFYLSNCGYMSAEDRKLINEKAKDICLLQKLFSIKNENNHKVLRFFGLKLKFRRKVKNAK